METNMIIQDKNSDIAKFSIIYSKIYEIRGQKVMLDFDLVEMYQIPTKRLKEQVKRNIERFPDDFMYQLTNEELQLVAKCDQFPERIKHSSVIPLAFMQESNTRFDKNDEILKNLFKIFDDFIIQKKNNVKPRNPIGFKQIQNLK